MTTTAAPVPVSQKKSSDGPNKVLLAILGVLAAVALFLFVVKPLFFGGDAVSNDEKVGTTVNEANTTGAAGVADGEANSDTVAGTTGGGATGASGTAAGDTVMPDDAAMADPSSDPYLSPNLAGTTPRDPFKPLVAESGTEPASLP
jgi:hypothetical protein